MDRGVSHEQWAAWKECRTARQLPLALHEDCVCVRSRNLTEVFAVQLDVGLMAGVFGPTHLPASGTNICPEWVHICCDDDIHLEARRLFAMLGVLFDLLRMTLLSATRAHCHF